MVLTHDEILNEIHNGTIQIDPFDETSIGPASIDLRLSNEIRTFENLHQPIKVEENTDYKQITTKELITNTYVLKPQELVLGMTLEKITLPHSICGLLNSRSRFARLGIMVHITAPFMQPGISNRQVLEIYNAGPNNLELIPGEKVCQFIFQRCEGEARYQGQFKSQEL